jgi:imidazole glycerol-phosphate synthase subunit HisH
MITIIDYGSGNLKSIKNGFKKINAEAIVSSSLKDINDAEALVLPGVGAFGTAMENLNKYKDSIKNHVDLNKPFLGICLGLQLLFTSSSETPEVPGLDIFKGEVLHFPDSLKSQGLKIPQMGWNQLEIRNKCPLLEGLSDDFMYFVHSYYVNPDDKDIIAATVNYGIDVPAVICSGNIFATQFHPEKSGEKGLQILKNFVNRIPK